MELCIAFIFFLGVFFIVSFFYNLIKLKKNKNHFATIPKKRYLKVKHGYWLRFSKSIFCFYPAIKAKKTRQGLKLYAKKDYVIYLYIKRKKYTKLIETNIDNLDKFINPRGLDLDKIFDKALEKFLKDKGFLNEG